MPKDPGDLQGLRVLVVEDNFLVADTICEVLAECGCVVVGPAPSLKRGRELSEDEVLDGAVLDVNLGGELSFPLADVLAKRGVPFLFLTGYDDKSILPDKFREVDRLSKPFDFDELVATVRVKFGGKRA
jgi:DNA-binding response OmpR family regulator